MVEGIVITVGLSREGVEWRGGRGGEGVEVMGSSQLVGKGEGRVVGMELWEVWEGWLVGMFIVLILVERHSEGGEQGFVSEDRDVHPPNSQLLLGGEE